MQKSSAHAWHFNTHRNENTKISVSTPCWQYWVNLSEAKKIRKTKTFKYMKYSSICTQNSNSKIADNIELGIMLNCTQFMIEVGICALKNVPLFAFSSSAVFFFVNVWYVHQIGVKPNQPYLRNISSKKWPPFLHLWSWYLIFWRTIVEMWIVNCKKLPMKTFNALLICNWILSKLLIIHYYLPGSKGLLTD